MKLVKLGLVIFLGAMVSPAFAQDQDAPNWQGFYAGGSLGQRSVTADWATTALCPLDGGINPCGTVSSSTATPSFNDKAVRFGAYLGYNWKLTSKWLAGAEADFGTAHNTQTISGIPGTYTNDGSTNSDTTAISTSWDGSLRVRVGYLLATDWLFYATSGLALISVSATENCSLNSSWCGGVTPSETYSKTLTGSMVGAGIEKFFGERWVARFEYRYADYGSFSHIFLASTANNADDDNSATVSFKSSMINLGLGYKF